MQRAEAEQAKTAPSRRGGGGFCQRPEGKLIGALGRRASAIQKRPLRQLAQRASEGAYLRVAKRGGEVDVASRGVPTKFWQQLAMPDERIANTVRAMGCQHCGGPLHLADYPRRPRGELGEAEQAGWSRDQPSAANFSSASAILGDLSA